MEKKREQVAGMEKRREQAPGMEKKQPPEAKGLVLSARDKEKLEPLADLDKVAEHISVDEFLHAIAEGITGRPKKWADIFGEQLGEVQPVIDACTLFFTRLVGNDIKGDAITKEITVSGIPAQHQALTREIVIVHYLPIQKALILQSSTISKAFLKDFDWQVQLIMASDKISNSREPLLRLTLTLVKDDQTTKEVLLELSKTELAELIAALTAANKVVKEHKA